MTEQGFKPDSARELQSLVDRQQEPGQLSLEQTQLKIGDSILVQLQTWSEKVRCLATLIGYLPGQSVIVSMPEKEGRLEPVREGQNLSVRFFSGKDAYAFSAVIRSASNTPYPHLHLSYPAEVRALVVRGSPRVQAHIEGHASSRDGSSYKVIARDISTGGALIASREQVGKVGEELLLRLPVKVDKDEHILELNCQIRSVNLSHASEDETPLNLLGLAFQRDE